MRKPLQVLQDALGKPVTVELRGQVQVLGVLDGFDPHMNLVLKKAHETHEGEPEESHETTLLRGDSVIYIST
jgi:small nuclear ribonucleoprotein